VSLPTGQLIISGIPIEAKFQVSLLSRVGGWLGGWVGDWVGGWGEIKIKAKLSPAKAGAWAELGKKTPLIVDPHVMETHLEVSGLNIAVVEDTPV
jgi:hypothetical protein